MAQIEVKEEYIKIAKNLAKMDDESLYETLGMQVIGWKDPFEIKREEGAEAYSFSLGFSGKKGHKFFKDNLEILKERICDRWNYCKKAEEYEGDFNKLMTALIPIVGAALGIGGVAIGLIITVCVLLFKYGLGKLCECKK